MKKLLILTLFTIPFLISCNKDDNGNATVNYSGTYKGTITAQTNGTTTSTLSDYSMQFTETGGGNMTISNSVFAANAGKVTGNTFTLTKKIVASAPTYNTEQTGTALFSSTNATISFKEQDVDISSGAVLNTRTWTGTLIKQ